MEYTQTYLKPARKSDELKAQIPEEEETYPEPSEAVRLRFTRFMKEQAKYCLPFIKEVDKKQYSDYTEIVKVEMYFMKIYNRLAGHYYRSMSALLHDVDLLESNARLYNASDSVVVRQATVLVDYLKLILHRAHEDPSSVVSSDRRDADKLLRQITAFGLLDKKFDFEQLIVENAPIGESPVQKLEQSLAFKRRVDEDECEDRQYKSRLRKSHLPVRRSSSLKLESEDDAVPSSQELRNRRHRHSRRMNEDSGSEDNTGIDMMNGGSMQNMSRAERHRLRMKAAAPPPVVNGGMKLRYRK